MAPATINPRTTAMIRIYVVFIKILLLFGLQWFQFFCFFTILIIGSCLAGHIHRPESVCLRHLGERLLLPTNMSGTDYPVAPAMGRVVGSLNAVNLSLGWQPHHCPSGSVI